jgi:Ca2+-binding EF-hand superfamily protein
VTRAAPVLLAALVVLAGCSWFGGGKHPEDAGPIYSPNGEPLSGGPLGRPECAAAMARWFARVDTNHDGTIDRAEFLADAARQFAVMDLDHDGVITPAELAQYRLPYAAPLRQSGETEDEARRRRERGGGSGSASIAHDRADPVMLADVHLRNRVTRDDFMAYANANFASLDADHDGRLSRAELVATCTPGS